MNDNRDAGGLYFLTFQILRILENLCFSFFSLMISKCILRHGETIFSETRNYDALKDVTSAMRSKEAANDYRFFPEPDLQPIRVTQEHIDLMKAEMPPLPNFLLNKYIEELGLSEYDANNLTDSKDIALYYEDMINYTSNYKSAANWLMGDIKSYLNQYAIRINEFPISAKNMAGLIKVIDDGKISHNLAGQKVFPKMLEETKKSALAIAEDNNWIQDSNEDSLAGFVQEIINENPDEASRFKGGEKKLMGLFMGQLMKKSKGKADPKTASQLINKMMSQ